MRNVVKYPGFTNIQVYYDNREITDLVESVTWSGDVAQAYRTLSVNMSNTINGRTRMIIIEKGKEMRFYHNGEFLFRGLVYADTIDSDGKQSITAYDENVYLTKSNDERKFTNVKASDIAKRLCSDFGIPVGAISDTGYVIPKLHMTGDTLYDFIIKALTLTKKQNGRRFFIYNHLGKLYLKERKEHIIEGQILVGSNLISASYSQSIEDLKTQVKVVGGNEKSPIIITVKDDTLRKKFGVMQHIESVDEKLSKSQVEQRARELLKQLGTINDDAQVTCIGNTKAVAGASMRVREPMTGIIGDYYITQDTHTFGTDGYQTTLTLSATDDLPEMEASIDD
ncbi:XkdQ/YqbQ family protein [Robertmurraya andreesenii]|uniref:YqbQ/XkdQ domain-containing protein n=1 Tax=Anoxybacillus andreesenii TaxID=1325932 RepID=A0ABT9V1W5_9BACL|nr:hypothetical protein [Robertmurraya andreesenii]MDQ0154906.1 hypothetical protein [Robertmurraya andreesenii]